MPKGEQELTRLAAEVAGELLARRGWRLVPPDELAGFAAGVAQDAQAQQGQSQRPLPELMAQLTVTHYCRRWHAACRAPAEERQQRAWLELHRQVSRVVRHFLPAEEVEDAAQAVLLRIYERLGTLEAPGSFLRWVDLVARNWCIDRYRRVEPATTDFDDELAEAGPFTPASPPTLPSEPLLALLERCLRSRAQRQVIIGRVLHNRSVEHLAEELGTTPGNIRVLTHRALERLKACDDFQAWLRAYRVRGADPHDDPGRFLRETLIRAFTCAECQARLPVYADLTLAGFDAPTRSPAVDRHLRGCVECMLALADLFELAEAEGDVPPS